MTNVDNGVRTPRVLYDPTAEVRATTVKDAAYRAGEEAANLAIASLRLSRITAVVSNTAPVHFASNEEYDRFTELAKMRLNTVLAYGLEEV